MEEKGLVLKDANVDVNREGWGRLGNHGGKGQGQDK